jgi:hypothetical protein
MQPPSSDGDGGQGRLPVRMLFAGTLVFSALGMLAAANPDPNHLVVHEWGTFLAMNGSDGVSLDGMYHE